MIPDEEIAEELRAEAWALDPFVSRLLAERELLVKEHRLSPDQPADDETTQAYEERGRAWQAVEDFK